MADPSTDRGFTRYRRAAPITARRLRLEEMMYFFDYSMLSGMPPIGVDLNLGAVVVALLVALLASSLGILCSRSVGLPRRGVWRWLSRPQGAATVERRSSRTAPPASEPITLPSAIRLTTGSRK